MARKRRRSELERDLTKVAVFGVGTAIGAGIASQAGAPAGVVSAFGTAARFTGPLVGIVALKHGAKAFKKHRRRFTY